MHQDRTLHRWAALFAAVGVFACSASAQSKCPAPPPLQGTGAPNIFSPQQEIYLGEVEAAAVEHNLRFIHDERMTGHLNRIAGRLLAQLPPTQLKFQVFLVDSPEIDSFSLAGGRIYITRKMVAFTQNDDEVAGLIGHEIGHVLSHQFGTDMTALFQQILGVTSVGDRKDIAEKFNRFIDNGARNPKALEKWNNREEPQQYQADQVALYAAASAGYSPERFVAFFDRLAQTKGRTGGFLISLLRATTPDEKRLRLLRKSLEELPVACRGAAPTQAADDFSQWQADVIGYSELDLPENLVGLLNKSSLDPPLRADITNLKFSPDGKYVLAQDESSVFVLARAPFSLLYRFDARDAHPAQFTPDSQSIVFDTRGLRVERWDVAGQKKAAAHELTILGGCIQTKLSPDGDTLACLDGDYSLSLFDVNNGSKVFQKKEFISIYANNAFSVLFGMLLAKLAGQDDYEIAQMQYSPDAHYFLAGTAQSHVAVDLKTHSTVPLHSNLGSGTLQGPFAFLAPDRLIAVNENDGKNSAVIQFPEGNVIDHLLLGDQGLSAAAHGNYAILRPVKDGLAAVMDLKKHDFPIITKISPAIDVYDETLVVERASGAVQLMDVDPLKTQSQASLSLSPLGSLKAAAVSPDLKWIAISGKTRGAVWNLTTAKRLYFTRGFHGAYFDNSDFLFVDFPKVEPQARMIARMHMETQQTDLAVSLDDKSTAYQSGPYVIHRQPTKDGGSKSDDIQLEVSDVRSGKLLWSRRFQKGIPDFTIRPDARTMLLQWDPDSPGLKEVLNANPTLAVRFLSIPNRKTMRLAEVLDCDTGKELGGVAIDTGKGSFQPTTGYAVGDFVVVADDQDRTRVYSLATGQLVGSVFGTNSTVSNTSNLLAVENQAGQLDIYRLPSLEKRGHISFSTPIALETFSADGKQLLVLTTSQNVYTFDTAAISEGTTTSPEVTK
jgi:WD40 repeat protein